MIVAVAVAETAEVEIGNVVDVLPAGTITEVPGLAEPDELDRVTDAPPVGAAPERVTVPVLEVPPVTEVGETERLVTVGRVVGAVKSPVKG